MQKKPYSKMTVKLVGKVNTVINKSGCYNDNSTQFDTKTRDNGGGNGGRIC